MGAPALRRFVSAQLGLSAVIALHACASPASEAEAPAGTPEARVHAAYIAEVERLQSAAGELERLARTSTDEEVLREAFAEARDRWKRVEFLAEQYTPVLSETLNGPPIPEVADDDPTRTVIPAEGFQMVEELLWPEYDAEARDALVEETGILAANVSRLAAFASATPLTAGNVFDAARHEILRIASLGLSGFDSPVAARSLPEAATALAGVRDALVEWQGPLAERAPAVGTALEAGFAAAIEALERESDFDSFDQLTFLAEHLDPLVSWIQEARVALAVELPELPRAWRAEAMSMFATDAFDPLGFAPPGTPSSTRERIELGRILFFDPALSGDGSRACASCHEPSSAFTDGLARSLAFGGGGSVARNAPTLLNAGLQRGSFADLRVAYLEDQAHAVIENPTEMHGSALAAAALLAESPEYRSLFERAFGSKEPPTEGAVTSALASYVRSLVAMESPFDRYLRGERDALTALEHEGFNVFMGRGKCGTCHFAPLFHGTVPPMYVETEVEILGVPARPDTVTAELDLDEGRALVLGNPLHRHAFRTPTVRNAGVTAPYMHNGVYSTLEEVVAFYDRGGGAGIGIALEHQTLPTDRLELTQAEKEAIVAFLHALTDTTSVSKDAPERLPSFPNRPELDSRPVGGSY